MSHRASLPKWPAPVPSPARRWAACLLFLASVSCAGSDSPARVIGTSIPPLGSLVREVVGDRFPVVSLLPPGRSPHDYEPTPSELDRLRNAICFAGVGTEVDHWMEGLVTNAMGSTAPYLTLRDPRPTQSAVPADPHLWLDLDAVLEFIPRLVSSLCEVDPEGAAGYRSRGDLLASELERLEAEAKTALAPSTKVPFALHHPAFVSLVNRFHLNLVAVLEPHPEAEARPRTLGEVETALRDSGATVVFAEEQLGTQLAEALAVDLGGTVAILDPLGGEGIAGRETYLDLLRWNIAQFVEHLHADDH